MVPSYPVVSCRRPVAAGNQSDGFSSACHRERVRISTAPTSMKMKADAYKESM